MPSMFTSLFFLFSITANVFSANEAGPVSTEVIRLVPSGDGYIGQVTFKYGLRNCYSGLHVNIDRKSVSASFYKYKGKNYSPSEVGLASFDKPSIGLVTLWADVYDKGSRIGNIKMYNVTHDTGAGCFGQTYNVAKAVGIDEKAASTRPQDFSFRSFRMEASSKDYKIEKLIAEKIKAATTVPAPITPKAATSSGPKVGTNAIKPNNSATKNSIQGKPVTSPALSAQAAHQNALDQKKAAQKAEIDKFQREQAQRNQEIDKVSKDTAKKVGDAATGFYKGLQGSNTAFGISIRIGDETDEQAPTWIGMVFGKYWNPNDPKAYGKWVSGVEFEFAFNSEWLGDELVTSFYDIRTEEWKRYNTGFFVNIVTNITTFGSIQPYLSFGFADYQIFGLKDEEVDSGNEFVTGYGLALNLDGKGLFKLGYNGDMETYEFSFGLMF